MILFLVFPVELDAAHSQRGPGADQGGVPPPQVKLKERQKFFEEAFQQDMEQYLSTGYLQIAERRGETDERFLKARSNSSTSFCYEYQQKEKKILDFLR